MKKKVLKKIYMVSLLSSSLLLNAATTYASDINITNNQDFIYVANDEIKDFKNNKEEAKKWGEKQEKEIWKLSSSEKQTLSDFVSDKGNIKTNYKTITFSMAGLFDSEINELKKIDNILNRASTSESVITYKNVEPTAIGFNSPLTNGNNIDSIAMEKFKNQFLGQDIKFDSYFETKLTEEAPNSKERILLKVLVPNNQGQATKTKAGVFLNNQEYTMLVNNNYVLNVEKISKVVKNGLECVQVEGAMKKSLDFKNDINGEADNWGKKNYTDWAGSLTAAQKEALVGYAGQDYKAINDYLRNQGGQGNAALDNKIKNISSSLNLKPLPESITLYRWCGMAEFGYNISDPLPSLADFEKKFLNTTKEDKGYLSTSLSSENLSAFGPRKFILRLQAPKGTKGAYINALGGFGSEKEILVDKGSKYHIDKITEVIVSGKKRYVIDATFLIN
ncbi:ADP-ribosyltransferase [Enterococcus ratti]|uniref:Vegetative insecticidal protein n=1 Tax=Enterococcus ratti TaxID=150033 RepID=A0A1L8WNU9_9ENTE|nr:ADP-ribosyltransferase [Enterococcus ratti]OJG82689.1 vegetative insecticidal protein [Enterococcus ratti]